jgi:protein SCO1/2
MFKRLPLLVLPALLSLGLLAGCGHKPEHWDLDYLGPKELAPLHFTGLQESDGKTVSAAHFRGKVVMLYFGYTHCPDICPLFMARMAHAIQLLGPQGRSDVRILFVTLDPKRDTPQVLQAYTQAFSKEARGLSGTPAQIKALAARDHIFYSYGKPGPHGNYVVNHSAEILVFNARGQGELIGDSLVSAQQIAHDLRQVLHMGA